MDHSNTPPVALTIAGSDSGGGAGIHADLRTMAAFGVHGATAITVVTAQNTTGIQALETLPARLVAQQIGAVLGDLNVRATKTGMLGSVEIVNAVAESVPPSSNLVVDPVLVRSNGEAIFGPDVRQAYIDRLIPIATVVTPNISEAELLVGSAIDDLRTQRDAARRLSELGPEWTVVKGARLDRSITDVVVERDTGNLTELKAAWVDTPNDHGSGCSLAAAIASGLANGSKPLDAIVDAKEFVTEAIAGAKDWRLGAGHGPIDHLGWSTSDQPVPWAGGESAG